MNDRLYRLMSGLYWRGYDRWRKAMWRGVRPARRLIAREQSIPGPSLPLKRRLWLWRRGFLSRDDALYDLNGDSCRRYVSEYQRELTRPLNGDWKDALDNKLHFHRLLEPFDDHRPALYAYLKRDRYVPVDSSDTESAANDVGAQVRNRIDRDGRLVVKPTYGTNGNRVLVCSRAEDGYCVNGEAHTAGEFEELIANLDGYLVCEFVEQADYAAELYPDSANTLRVLTMWDPETDEPFVAFVTHRIGTDRSAPVDNFSRGGLSVGIDPVTGELGRGVQFLSASSLDWHETHPETGARVAGVAVPGWSAIRDGVLDIAAQLPQLPYVGWDLVVTEEGAFTMVEANSCTDVTLQVHGPLLDDPRVRRFYEHHDIIPAE